MHPFIMLGTSKSGPLMIDISHIGTTSRILVDEPPLFKKDDIVHIQDTDFLLLSAKVGIPDLNNIVWDTAWVPFEHLQPLK